jgi:hypothetical protein
MASSSPTPKLIIPEEKSTNETSSTCASSKSSMTIIPSSSEVGTQKLTKILSTQSSVERHQSPHPVAKRFSIDADPSSIILNTPVTDLSNNPLQQPTTPDIEESSSILSPLAKESSPARSPSLKKSDSFLEIPYEKGEIVDLIKFADDPNAATHITNNGHEVLLEHASPPPS